VTNSLVRGLTGAHLTSINFTNSNGIPDSLRSFRTHARTARKPAFRHTLEQARPIRRHAADIRGVLPLGFARYYFALLAGRDHRDGTRREEQKLRQTMSSVLSALVLGGVMLVPILSAILLMS
jgi:hypothetical protein